MASTHHYDTIAHFDLHSRGTHDADEHTYLSLLKCGVNMRGRIEAVNLSSYTQSASVGRPRAGIRPSELHRVVLS